MDALADEFEAQRGRLIALATRILGPGGDAEDVVQEAWLRLARTEAASIDHLGKWLTTVTSRLCLDALRAKGARPATSLEVVPDLPDLPEEPESAGDPEAMAAQADDLGAALLLVLDQLTPPERLAFVLHDLFGMPFGEIAPILDASMPATRQLASRARRKVRGGAPGRTASDTARRRREVVQAFLAASKAGEFDQLLALLDPDAQVRPDAAAAAMGTDATRTGAQSVAEFFAGRAQAARYVLIDGEPGLVWALKGEVKVAFVFTLSAADQVQRIDLVADAQRIAAMSISTTKDAVGLD